ncbi:hypothetical protein [Alloactinosynnema sp. L-07]|uniref:F-box protein n=1 Tax=Alloactinosynnema sp. L-07 TaxID=1653480 RepID=UPI00065F05D1|nr:F-box protein [Alloactinosynnema sp. L-07]CRK60369.1 hypothetical protein [Alloactinosynnema sp. L-07]
MTPGASGLDLLPVELQLKIVDQLDPQDVAAVALLASNNRAAHLARTRLRQVLDGLHNGPNVQQWNADIHQAMFGPIP